MAMTFQLGSTGDTRIKKMQDMLSGLGYNMGGESGTYGTATQAAVKQFQTDNGLAANGVFDNNTLQSIYAAQKAGKTASTAATPAAQTTPAPEPATQKQPTKYEGYTPTQAQPYQSQYDGVINGLLEKITNRKPYAYDPNSDALFLQYKDQYSNFGRQAMMDTMGQAAQLTGGYGNSYASTAGNQAYQQYMTQLADKVPELAQMGYERDAADDARQQQMFALYNQMDQQGYGRYRDTVADQQAADQMGYNNYWQAAEMENSDYWKTQGQASDMLMAMITMGQKPSAELVAASGYAQGDVDKLYNTYKDQIAAEQAAAKAAAAKKSSGGGGGGSKKTAGKAPTESMYDQALDAFNNGGATATDQLLDKWEMLGYDVSNLEAYVNSYGKTKPTPTPASGGSAGSGLRR